ncbi:hypothetical protein [Nocardioides aurantiacus]|uniref:hypothetical protein n=1 Tax=Nocardioides aurantiacus TaxID=86796 RepID=UPI00403FABCD
MRSCLDRPIRGASEVVSISDGPRVQFARLIRAHAGLFATNPVTARVTDPAFRALSDAPRDELLALRDDYESMFGMVIDRGCRADQFKFADKQIAHLTLLEMCNSVAHWYRLRADSQLPTFNHASWNSNAVSSVDAATGDEIGPAQAPVRSVSEPVHAAETPQETV